jgi:hypothetical protein
MPTKTTLSKQIRLKQTKLKRLGADLTKVQASIDDLKARLNRSVDRDAGKSKKSATTGNLRKKVTEKQAEFQAIADVIKIHETKLEELLQKQDADALQLKAEAWLNDEEKLLLKYNRCESLKVDLVNLLGEIASERDNVLLRLIRLVEVEGIEPLKAAGIDFEAVLNRWQVAVITMIDFPINERIQAISIARLNLLNELQALVDGTFRYYKVQFPPVLKQAEPPNTKNLSYEERRKLREAAIAKVGKIKHPTFKIHNAPKGDSRSD